MDKDKLREAIEESDEIVRMIERYFTEGAKMGKQVRLLAEAGRELLKAKNAPA